MSHPIPAGRDAARRTRRLNQKKNKNPLDGVYYTGKVNDALSNHMNHTPKHIRLKDGLTPEEICDTLDAVRKYATPEAQEALAWNRCRPSEQWRRADTLHREVIRLTVLVNDIMKTITSNQPEK